MLSKLSIRNVKRSFSDYSIYFLTLTLGVCFFYSFNSIEAQQFMLDLSANQQDLMGEMTKGLAGVSVFVSFILSFLILYANQFLVKRRKKELGIYKTLGMSKWKVSRLFLMETLVVGIFALVSGLVLGSLMSQGFSFLASSVFNADLVNYEFVFSIDAMNKTIVFFSIIFMVVIIFNTIVISRFTLLELIYGSKKNENVKIKNPVLGFVIFLISLSMIVVSYVGLMHFGINGGLLLIAIFMAGISLLCVVVGAGTFLKGSIKSNDTKVTYSNLADEKTLNEVASLLEGTGVSKENTDIFKSQVKYTNDIIEGYPSLKDGFVTIKGTGVEYNSEVLFNYFANAMIEADFNCRIGAWPMINDIVNVEKPWTIEQVNKVTRESGGILGYEKDVIEVNEYAHMNENDLTKFWGLYESIPFENHTSIKESAKHIQDTLVKRGITFEGSKRSLISMYLYNPQERVFEVKHAGVLIERENDLMFVERVNPTSPYQAAIFENRGELKFHLDERFKEYGVPEAVIMENGEQLNTK